MVHSLALLEFAFPRPLHFYDKADIKLHREFLSFLSTKNGSEERHPPSCLSCCNGGNEVMNSTEQNPDDVHDFFYREYPCL